MSSSWGGPCPDHGCSHSAARPPLEDYRLVGAPGGSPGGLVVGPCLTWGTWRGHVVLAPFRLVRRPVLGGERVGSRSPPLHLGHDRSARVGGWVSGRGGLALLRLSSSGQRLCLCPAPLELPGGAHHASYPGDDVGVRLKSVAIWSRRNSRPAGRRTMRNRDRRRRAAEGSSRRRWCCRPWRHRRPPSTSSARAGMQRTDCCSAV